MAYPAIIATEGFTGLFRGAQLTFFLTLMKMGVQYQYFATIRNFFFTDGEYNYTVS